MKKSQMDTKIFHVSKLKHIQFNGNKMKLTIQ